MRGRAATRFHVDGVERVDGVDVVAGRPERIVGMPRRLAAPASNVHGGVKSSKRTRSGPIAGTGCSRAGNIRCQRSGGAPVGGHRHGLLGQANGSAGAGGSSSSPGSRHHPRRTRNPVEVDPRTAWSDRNRVPAGGASPDAASGRDARVSTPAGSGRPRADLDDRVDVICSGASSRMAAIAVHAGLVADQQVSVGARRWVVHHSGTPQRHLVAGPGPRCPARTVAIAAVRVHDEIELGALGSPSTNGVVRPDRTPRRLHPCVLRPAEVASDRQLRAADRRGEHVDELVRSEWGEVDEVTSAARHLDQLPADLLDRGDRREERADHAPPARSRRAATSGDHASLTGMARVPG